MNCSPFQAFVPGDVAKRYEQKTPVTGEVNCSPKPWISLKTIVFSLSLRFFTFCLSNSNTMFSTVLINQGFVAQIISFSKYRYISCCPWSEVYMILAFSPPTPHPISLLLVICFKLMITQTVFDFPWSYQELTVHVNGYWLMMIYRKNSCISRTRV